MSAVNENENHQHEVETPLENVSLRASRRESDTSSRKAAALTGGGETNTLQRNPFALLSYQVVIADAERLHAEHGLPEGDLLIFKNGAALAKAQEHGIWHGHITEINLEEKDTATLEFEKNHPWKSLPLIAYFLASVCAGCAVVQGADQTIINGAQSSYFEYFRIDQSWSLLRGFVNGAPYISAALIGCWVSAPLNDRFGRRWVLFVGLTIAVITAIWQAASPSWPCFIAARFILGLAVGSKSATTPTYAAEMAPKSIRGALVMQWQTFTAFGIMLGYTISLVFQHAAVFGPHTEWRLMIGTTAVPPLIVMFFIFTLPESPRWYIEKGRLADSYGSFCKLRAGKILAARDFYSAYKHHEALTRVAKKGTRAMFAELMTPRNRRALQHAAFVMIMQQFCGVNVLAYYSTRIFTESGFAKQEALLASLGCGIVNFIGALPAFFTIDRYGRRRLLLVTLPALSALLFITAAAYSLDDKVVKVPVMLVTLYCFMFAYSPGMGPVPFTYSAEAFSLAARPLGMSAATSITWTFNFIISFTFPKMLDSLGGVGAFSFFAACNLVGAVYTYFYLPETKEMSLEYLDVVFSKPCTAHAREKRKQLGFHGKKYILRMDVKPVGTELSELPATAQGDEEANRSNLEENQDSGGSILNQQADGAGIPAQQQPPERVLVKTHI